MPGILKDHLSVPQERQLFFKSVRSVETRLQLVETRSVDTKLPSVGEQTADIAQSLLFFKSLP